MKPILTSLCLCLIFSNIKGQQNWLTTGNGGLTSSNFLGSTDATDLTFRSSNTERGRLLGTGVWRLGTATNFAKVDVNGKLSFGGKGNYVVGGNRYVFQYSGNNNYGLFFNSTTMQYEFRNGNAQPVFLVNANTGNGTLNGDLQAGSLKIGIVGPDHSMFDSNGNLSFSGNAAYLVKDNQFALLCNGEPGDGLYMNGDLNQWEFRDEQSFPYFAINEKTHLVSSWGGFNAGKGSDYASLDSFGNLRFSGNAAYILKDGQYAFICDGARSEGLYMNDALEQWEFRDSSAKPVFTLNNNTGNFSALGALRLGNTSNNIAGSIRFTGTDFEGYSGNTWRSLTAANGAWLATGNKGSNPSVNFIGTADNQPLIFRTNNIEAVRVNGDGKVGIGTNAPGNYSVKINHGTFGLDLANAASGLHWEHFVNNTGDMLFYYNAGANPIGSFNHTSGAYSALSDERMKTNIQPVQNILEKIKLLKPVAYNFSSDKEQKQYMGFIAQDVQKIFPSLVTHVNNDRSESYLMDYSGFGVIAVEGIKELKKENDDLKKELEDLKNIVLSLQTQMSGKAQASSSSEIVELKMVAKLEQNTPNPFNHSTTINYSLPQQYSSAKIIVMDKTGRVLKEINLSTPSHTGGNWKGAGSVTVDASTLTSGAYNYSLYVDGKLVSTKQMEHIK